MANKNKGLLSKVPLPDTFFSIKHQLRPIAPLRLSAPSAAVIYLLTLGGFVGCWIFYSLPGPLVTTKVTQPEWQKEGYVCKPLQKDKDYDLMLSYDECLEQINVPSATTLVVTQSPAPTLHWYKYVPFGNGKALQNGVVPSERSPLVETGCGYSDVIGPVEFGSTLNDAIKCFEVYTAAHPVCDAFKQNAPFECTKTEISYKSPLEILSLSIANTQLLFGVLTAFFAHIFYKLKKKDEVLPAGEAGWQEAVENLEKRLRKEFQQALTKKADKTGKETV